MAIAAKSLFLIGDTSSNGWFSIVMFVFRGVVGEIHMQLVLYVLV